jgi:hypothetical protein
MSTSDQTRIEELEKEVKRLNIKLETLINFLQFADLGPPDGRAPYDAKVKQALAQAGLQA